MATPDATAAPDPDELMLARLAEMDMAAAVEAHARMMAAETAEQFNDLGRTYQRMARSARQSIALKARLKREREQLARPPRPPLSEEYLPARVRNHIDRATALALRFTERDAPDRPRVNPVDISDVLVAIAIDEGETHFLATPTEALVAQALDLIGWSHRKAAPHGGALAPRRDTG